MSAAAEPASRTRARTDPSVAAERERSDKRPGVERETGARTAGKETTTAASRQLKAFVERIERVQQEIDELNRDKSDIYQEAKGSGFDVKILKQVVRLRAQDAAERQEQAALLDLYLHALGMAPAAPDEPE